jgi:hypothetical protein
MKQNKHIGDLFKDKLSSYEDSDINQDWDEMELKLNKQRFFKFSFTNFNIYYCSSILATLALSSVIFIKTFCFQENIQQGMNSSSISIIDSFSNTKAESPSGSIAEPEKNTGLEKNNYNGGNSLAGKKDEKAGVKTQASPLGDNKEATNPEGTNKAVNTPGKFNSLDNDKTNDPSSTNISDKEVSSKEKQNNKNGSTSGKINASEKNDPSSTDMKNGQITNKKTENTANSADQKTGNVAHSTDQATEKKQSGSIDNNAVNTVHSTEQKTGNAVHSTDQTTDKKQSGSFDSNTVIDNLNIHVPKKNVVYITKQDTVEVFDTLRRKKPYSKRLK